MKYDITQQILDYDGKPAQEKGKEFTFKKILCETLPLALEEDTSEVKVKIFEICMKVFNATDTLELTADQAAFVKERVLKIGSPLLIGRINEWIDQTTESNDVTNP